ncbi:unnamed protein product, partial [marine sediment metagenome]
QVFVVVGTLSCYVANGYYNRVYILESGFLGYLDKENWISLINQQFPGILTIIGKLPELIDELLNSPYFLYDTFSQLLKLAREKGWNQEIFSKFLESVENLPHTFDKYYCFSDLIDSIKNTNIINNYSSEIESLFLVLVEGINKITEGYDSERIDSVCSLILKVARITGLIKEHIPTLLNAFSNLDSEDYIIYDDLLSAITNKTQRFEFFKYILENTEDADLKTYILYNFFTIVEDSKFVKENFVFIMLFFEEALEGYYPYEQDFSEAYNFILKFIEKLIDIGFLNVKISVHSSNYSRDYYER